MNQKKECMDVHVNGLKFHVQTFGSGVPIIMIMGLGAPGDKWKHNYELLSKWFWCIVPDNRGAGLSDKPEAESYTTEQMADDIIGIMDALDIKKAHVMGVSMGGAIAQQVALKVPDRVLSLILTSTFASVSPAFKKALKSNLRAERRYRSGSIKAVESLDDLWTIHADTSSRED